VRSLSEVYAGLEGVALAVSLDIVNAFNSLPWDRIGEAIHQFGFPEYLRKVVWNYFRDRTLFYTDRAEVRQKRGVYCSVPQRSVLGPLLWDIGYDVVLRTKLPPGSSVVCYTDDTLVLTRGDNWEKAVAASNQAVAGVVRAIRMSLEVAPHKTEALFFRVGSRRGVLGRATEGPRPGGWHPSRGQAHD
jgi:hypothetical protein